jgi:chemotaxis response regulator CheB
MAKTVDSGLCDVVAIVGSAGAVGAMGSVLEQLPADLDAAVVVVST